jgi:cytochrome c biogenesis protein CcdA
MKKIIFLITLLVFISLSIFSEPNISISPFSYNFQSVQKGTILKDKISITNTGDEILILNISSPCECLIVHKNILRINPNSVAKLPFVFHTETYSGFVSFNIIIETNDPDIPIIFFTVEGNVVDRSALSDEIESFTQDLIPEIEATNLDPNKVEYFTYLNCKSCIPITKRINEWAKKNNRTKNLQIFDLTRKVNQEKLYKLVQEIDSFPKLPLILYQNKIFSGKEEIDSFLENKEVIKNNKQSKLSLIAIILAGLLDGINPCAFTAIILLISYLSINSKSKNSILLSGIIYILAVLITYFLIGIGIFQFIKIFQHYSLFSNILKYGLSICLFILATLSIYDYIKSINGKNNEMVLKLPSFLDNSMRKNIRFQMKDFKIFMGSITLGILVSLFELVCTGQVYFPILGHMVRSSNNKIYSLSLLIIYNLSFILPMVIIFILTYTGISSKKIGQFLSNRVSLVKFLFILLFIALGLLNILY